IKSFTKFTSIIVLTPVYLPDGTIKMDNHMGSIILHTKLCLKAALHIPDFTDNLLSVNQLTINAQLRFIFYSDHFVLQALQSEKILAIGKVTGQLHVLDKTCFSAKKIKNYSRNLISVLSNSKDSTNCYAYNAIEPFVSIWHKRLGHASIKVLQHI